MTPIRILRRIRCHEEGATAVEFAIVAVMFFTLLCGVIEYGMIMLTKVAIESALIQVSRDASIGKIVGQDLATSVPCKDRACAVIWLVNQKTLGLVNHESVFTTSTVVSKATTDTPSIPDLCLDDPADPYPATCTGSYIDNALPAGYQKTDNINTASVGAAGQVIEIRVTYLWRVLFPMFEIFQSYAGAGGKKGFVVITSSAVIKNEPFGNIP